MGFNPENTLNNMLKGAFIQKLHSENSGKR